MLDGTPTPKTGTDYDCDATRSGKQCWTNRWCFGAHEGEKCYYNNLKGGDKCSSWSECDIFPPLDTSCECLQPFADNPNRVLKESVY